MTAQTKSAVYQLLSKLYWHRMLTQHFIFVMQQQAMRK
ncbi:hypothetical protein LHGZ1_1837 [Laribacter hongkongensis]|uniref:Uncharacterized protein n=1 Tax=Laribacter hongkongensis TaxID=168471 RepID=A0A248LIU1_9NEIS|nr:hypothetical protein LHGZ1_1837 [Laribacter hongkongensis]